MQTVSNHNSFNMPAIVPCVCIVGKEVTTHPVLQYTSFLRDL